jgi:hypothetical protein
MPPIKVLVQIAIQHFDLDNFRRVLMSETSPVDLGVRAVVPYWS